MKTMNPETIAAETIAILRDRAVNAIRYSEAYEGTRRTVVADGSQYSPSDRVLPRGELMFQAGPDAFWAWSEAVNEFIDSFELNEDSDGEPESWSLFWEDGVLWASLPELPDF